MRLKSHKGVFGVLVFGKDWVTLHTTLDVEETKKFGNMTKKILTTCTESLNQLDSENKIQFLQVRTTNFDCYIVLERDYCLVTLQRPERDSTSFFRSEPEGKTL
jgi:dynein light chain roadblock-type